MGKVKEQVAAGNYDLAHPEVFKMPALLNEISGIAFNKGNEGMIYAEQDEDGKVFMFHLGINKVLEIKFGRKGDYEDIALTNDHAVILRSDGTFFTFPLSETNNQDAANVQEFKKLLPPGEYEGLFADNTNNKLYALCKHCNEKLSEISSVYVLSFDNRALHIENTLSVNVKDIATKAGIKRITFQPSALAKNNTTGDWFILSSVNKLLVVAASDFSIKNVYRLDPSVYNQPEGIAFDAENNLYISNEKGNTNAATVLKISYRN